MSGGMWGWLIIWTAVLTMLAIKIMLQQERILYVLNGGCLQ